LLKAILRNALISKWGMTVNMATCGLSVGQLTELIAMKEAMDKKARKV
jgi:hypothetical protein